MRAVLISVLVLTVGAAAPAAASDRSELRAAQERWAAADLTDYSFKVAIGCFCPPNITKPRRVVVRNGRAVDPPQVVRRYSTIPKLFGVIRKAIEDEVDELNVTYGKTGMPREIFIDRSRMIADEELSLYASRLRPLP